jgi:hypothetical protein
MSEHCVSLSAHAKAYVTLYPILGMIFVSCLLGTNLWALELISEQHNFPEDNVRPLSARALLRMEALVIFQKYAAMVYTSSVGFSLWAAISDHTSSSLVQYLLLSAIMVGTLGWLVKLVVQVYWESARRQRLVESHDLSITVRRYESGTQTNVVNWVRET